MLVGVWNAMDAAIYRIAAQEWMDSYTIQVVANPYADKKAREGILNAWRKMISGKWDSVVKSVRGDNSNGHEYSDDGIEIHRRIGLPLREIHRQIQNAFGRGIRD